MALPTNTGSVSDAQNNPLGLANAETTDFQPTRSEQPQMLQAFQAHPPRTRRKQVEDPREFQLGQMRRRYSPKEEQTDGGTSLIFAMAPSDPDFPFDIEALECILHVPLTYPTDGRPSLRVTNKQMGRGYQINVERGFDAIATDAPNATLLVLMNKLDKQLETLLSAQKADTIKLVSNVGRASFRSGSATTKTAVIPDKQTTPTVVLSKQPMKSSSVSYSTEQKALAEAKRESEVRQLEARLGRLPLFSKSSDGIAFTIPIEPRQRSRLPAPLQAVKSVKLFVPLLYNLQPCRIQLMGVSGESAAQVELGFEQHASKSSDMSLMSHINFLSQNMHTMAIEPPRSKLEEAPDMGVLSIEERPTEALPSDRQPESIDPDRSHIHVIPRPPEWTVGGEEEDGSSSDDGSLTYDSGDDTEEEESEGGPVASQTTPAERGIMLSFPFLELHGIELLELVSLSITVKCERCKDLMDVERLKNNTTGDYSSVRQLSCKKCASPLGISYRMDMMHANSVRAGYLDLDGCTVVDML
ncbi:hypothetical protein LTR39_001716, partial [Cryomyces antarcticus]